MVDLGAIVRSVVRAKMKAAGAEWRRLHRVESLLTLAAGRIRAVAKRARRKRKPKEEPQK